MLEDFCRAPLSNAPLYESLIDRKYLYTLPTETRTIKVMDDANLVELLGRRAIEHPKQVCHTYIDDGPGESLSYDELNRKARVIASHLKRCGAQGERTLLIFPDSLDFVPALFGCFYAGSVAVPVAAHKRRLLLIRAIVRDCQPKVILTSASMLESARDWLREAQEIAPLRWITVDTIDYGAEPERGDVCPTYELAFLQYTSGSTTTPKGVMVTHQNLMDNVTRTLNRLNVDSNTVFFSWSPFFHDMGLIGGVIWPVFADAPVYLMSPTRFVQRPGRWLAAMTKYRVTITGAPNFAYDLCVDRIPVEDRKTFDLSCWRVAGNAAEAVRHSTLDRFSEAFRPCGFRRETFCPMYGLAESTLVVSLGEPEAEAKRCTIDRGELARRRVAIVPEGQRGVTFVGCGTPLPGHSIRIVDPHERKVVPTGCIGEIWVRGSSVARGYWGGAKGGFDARLAETEEASFLRTGDLGFLLDGELFITGRIKDVIVIDGRNLFAEDIETVVERAHPRIETNGCAVFSIEVAGREQLIVTAELAHPCRGTDFEEIVRLIRSAVATIHEGDLHGVVLVRSRGIPRTTSGKLRRSECRRAYLEHILPEVYSWHRRESHLSCDSSNHARGVDAIESWLVKRLAHYLRVDPNQIDARQPIESYGLNSKEALLLSGELSERIGKQLSPTLLYEVRTIEDLGIALREQGANTEGTTLPDSITPEQARALLAEVATLSEAQIGKILGGF